MDKLIIWLVDDDRDDRFLFKYTIEDMGKNLEVITVPSCDEFMRQLYYSDGPLPDIVFMDLNMPGKSGLDCLQTLKSEDKFQSIKAIIYSTSANQSDVSKAYRLGANLYIQKPFDMVRLSETITRVLYAYSTDSLAVPEESKFLWGA